MARQKEEGYIVLARKYRPKTFEDVIGQEAMVRTLRNAIHGKRLPQAFILTGIRGTGKTSTARIIARALNCIGEDGQGKEPVIAPCGVCEHCKAISEDRHVDVLEMDAASKTGVNDIREIIENAHYLPSSARYKVYIIDEVHMLSKSAFNALLKTLEEPPPHVVFLFATTEIRKIPVTILSRCMRFDLARVEKETLAAHLKGIAEKEGIEAEDAALAMIANAAEGSVRDALSLLDQAIAHASGGTVQAEQVQHMLGLVGKERLLALFEEVVSGHIAEGIGVFRDLYRAGGSPAQIIQDLAEITHFLTQFKILPELEKAEHIPEYERGKGKELATKLSLAHLARMWQVLLKGVGETQTAPNPSMAAEMVLVRLACLADLPPPGDLIKQWKKEKGSVSAVPVSASAPAPAPRAPAHASARQPIPGSTPLPQQFERLVDLFDVYGEPFLHNWLQEVQVTAYDVNARRLAFRMTQGCPADLPNQVSERLRAWTGQAWAVVVSNEGEDRQTLREQRQDAYEKEKQTLAEQDPDVKAILEAFPGAEIVAIHKPQAEVIDIADHITEVNSAKN
ncbi:MAG: DNA polymerase III subunit gamma/tau [Hyphomicrobiales bacterium]|nr:DNA polymerase III subunit gamma/tau [Hyphomicrobiales bacterium]